jgi:hypothetical protein
VTRLSFVLHPVLSVFISGHVQSESNYFCSKDTTRNVPTANRATHSVSLSRYDDYSIKFVIINKIKRDINKTVPPCCVCVCVCVYNEYK